MYFPDILRETLEVLYDWQILRYLLIFGQLVKLFGYTFNIKTDNFIAGPCFDTKQKTR